jgi:hypothetical protein
VTLVIGLQPKISSAECSCACFACSDKASAFGVVLFGGPVSRLSGPPHPCRSTIVEAKLYLPHHCLRLNWNDVPKEFCGDNR